MKKLAVLCGLALLAAPCLSNMVISNYGSQVLAADDGDSSSVDAATTITRTILFGEEVAKDYENGAAKGYYDLSGFNIQPTFTFTKCYNAKDATAFGQTLKIGSTKNAGSVKIDFNTSIDIKKVVVTAEGWSDDTSSYSIKSGDDLSTDWGSNTYAATALTSKEYACPTSDGTKSITLIADKAQNCRLHLSKKEIISSSVSEGNITNLEACKTKAKLNYKYTTYDDSTSTVYFGDNKYDPKTAATDGSLAIDGLTNASIAYANCYGSLSAEDSFAKSNTLKVGNSSNKGSITITFGSAIVKEVTIYASRYSTSHKPKFSVTSSAYATSNYKDVVGDDGFESYTWSGLDNNNFTPSTSVTIESKNATNSCIYLSKIEIVTSHDTKIDDGATYTISDIGLRFGGAITKSVYESVESHITSFGMVYTTSLPEGYATLKDAISASPDGFTPISDEKTLLEAKPVSTTIDEEECYLFNVYLSVSEESLDKVVYAIAKVTLDNGNTYYLEESSYSVESIAVAYYDSGDYSSDTDIENTLLMLAMGSVKETL